MLSENERHIRNLIESGLSGSEKEKAQLYHYSTIRKLEAVKFWLQDVENLTKPDLIIRPQSTLSVTASGSAEIIPSGYPDPELTLTKISAYIDAFFMSGKSTLDAFAHEVRNLYGFSGHSGDLYFENVLDLLPRYTPNSELSSYLSSTNIINLPWYQDLKSYRHASTHESIIGIKPSVEMDFFTGEWKPVILKLPLDPTQIPLQYDGKNFIETGKLIRDELQSLIINSYDKILGDIQASKTIIAL